MTKTTNTKISNELQGQLVDTKHVESLLSTYKKERWEQNSERIGKKDSLSVWYGLTELEAFLNLAKEQNADGIKIYFGVYPNDYLTVPEFRGRQTVVIVATKKKESEKGIIDKNIYKTENFNCEILAFNYGKVCPPYCTFEKKQNDNNFIPTPLNNKYIIDK